MVPLLALIPTNNCSETYGCGIGLNDEPLRVAVDRGVRLWLSFVIRHGGNGASGHELYDKKGNWKCFKIVVLLPSVTHINTKTRKHEINSLQTNMIENFLSNSNFYLYIENNSRDIPNNNFRSPPLPVEHTWSIFIGQFWGSRLSENQQFILFFNKRAPRRINYLILI